MLADGKSACFAASPVDSSLFAHAHLKENGTRCRDAKPLTHDQMQWMHQVLQEFYALFHADGVWAGT
jgi:hypothetical protein